ncbi:ABC transporter ATP-binding protein [Kordiimonas sp.]|uniref:ABC transporter ATP-binding protein n=1 Tax=Kordiimonas sp. TaxID=1970157 RepID=UPI003A8D5678
MSGTEKRLAASNLCVSLGGKDVLHNLSFDVNAGEVVGLIGPNGAGKSTALKAILDIVETGQAAINVDGSDTRSLAPKERAKKLAYVPQGAPVHWPLTAERVVGLGRTPHLNPWQQLGAHDRATVKNVMQTTDCWSMRDRIVTTLSGGERSRVLLARALAVGAPYLLADEPTASLDPLHQLQVMEIMRAVATSGVGVLIVMHDLSFALRYCDRLVLLTDGKVLASGTPADVLTDENLEAAFGVAVSRWGEGGEQFLAPHRVKVRP